MAAPSTPTRDQGHNHTLPGDALVDIESGRQERAAAGAAAAPGKDVSAAGTLPLPAAEAAGDNPQTQAHTWTRKERLLLRHLPVAVRIPEALACIVVALCLFFVPRPPSLSVQAWGLFSIFAGTILGLILEPLPVAPVALTGVTVALWTGTMTYSQAFSAFTSDTVWLIVGAFFFAKGVEVTGLGERVADVFISGLGHSALGLAYALMLAELLLCLCMPSTTARAAGVFVPVITSLSSSFGSLPRWQAADSATLPLARHPLPLPLGSASAAKLGEFLMMSQAQVSSATSAMFLLGAAQTPIALELAATALGRPVVSSPFAAYLKGSILPSAVLVVLIPLAVYWLHRPEVRRTPWAPKEARQRLRAKGRLSWREWVMLLTLSAAVVLWCTSAYFPFKLSNASIALLGVVVLIASGAVSWADLLAHTAAWDLLIWLPILFSMCASLGQLGVIGWLSAALSAPLLAARLGPSSVLWVVNVLYFVLHYVIAGQAAHITALFPPFFQVLVTAGVRPDTAALSLAYTTNLFGAITQYASAQAAAYYQAGFFPLRKLWVTGGLLGFGSLGLFLAIGWGFWWRAVGLW